MTESIDQRRLPSLPADDPWRDLEHEVLLCNFGGPERAEEVEPFLRTLFEDPFIIRAPLPLWLRLRLAARIARKRAPNVATEYASIGYSAINRYTALQARHLETLLRTRRPGTRVHVVNRYTAPRAADVVRTIRHGRSRLHTITMYPHFCHSTTVSSLRELDLAYVAAHGGDTMPGTRVWSWWHEAAYLGHTWAGIRGTLAPLLADGGNITVLSSAHGLPERYLRRGDPYVAETRGHHTELEQRCRTWLAAAHPDAQARIQWHLAFQSRVGPMEWVRPYTTEVIPALGRERGGTLVMVPISFTSDHIETLYEMDHTYKELALASGFERFVRVIPSNEDPELAACLAAALCRHGF